MRSILATSLLGSALVAQTPIVTPPAAVNLEGNGTSGVTFTNVATRTQQVDRNLMGAGVLLIRQMSFRRNSGAQSTRTARNINITLTMGVGVATTTTTFATNFVGTPTTVHAKKLVSLPDLTADGGSPSPFDITIKLDRPYPIDRTQPFCWDLICENNSAAGQAYNMDWISVAPTTTRGSKPIVVGTGCTTNSGTMTYTTNFTADASNIILGVSVTGATRNAPLFVIVGATNPDIPIGCGRLHSDLLLLAPAGTANSNGGTNTTLLQVPWNQALAGVTLFTQMIAVDMSQPALPFAFSNGIQSSTPFAKGGQAIDVQRLWTSAGTGPTGTRSDTAAPVEFQ